MPNKKEEKDGKQKVSYMGTETKYRDGRLGNLTHVNTTHVMQSKLDPKSRDYNIQPQTIFKRIFFKYRDTG